MTDKNDSVRHLFPDEIDALLPQTQCGLCGYEGCLPYAEALAFSNAPINLCPPGGIKTLQALGQLLGEDPSPYLKDMETKTKPPMIARIRETQCIGCTKCIQACPVDAIVGSTKLMHTIISAECTGCELCVPPCPVNCIDMEIISAEDKHFLEKANHARARFNQRKERIIREKKITGSTKEQQTFVKKKQYVQEAIARNKLKKLLRKD